MCCSVDQQERRPVLRALCLASVFCLAAASSSVSLPFKNRFGRELLSLESTIPAYLLPTQLPSLCHGSDCCQEDDYTSAFEIMMLNSSQVMSGGRTYTTFYMNLQRATLCDTVLDVAGCCNANVSSIWIDIDPELMVLYTTLNSQRWANSVQDSYGFRMIISPQQYVALPATSLLSVTVLGNVDQLCPLPDMAPVPGYCTVILEGGVPSNPTACCPQGVSRPSNLVNWVPPNTVACQADLTLSPFSVAQAYISNLYIGSDDNEYVDYTLNLTQNMACREGINSCCGMTLSDLQIKILDSAQVTGVTLNGSQASYTTSEWFDTNSSEYQVLALTGLQLHVEDLPRGGGWPLVITVAVPANANAVPQLCSATDTVLGQYGACSYYLYSDDGYCCPSGNTNTVTGPILPNTCAPTQEVAIADTSFGFMYYEYESTTASTNFTFLVSSDSSNACSKTYCVGVCGWELAVNDAIIPDSTYSSDSYDNAARTTVQRGSSAAINFAFTAGSSQAQYTISTPAGTALEQLCRANAYPDQAPYPCAATLQSASVYAVVYFSQDSLVMKVYPDICPVSQSLNASCLQPVVARYNWPDEDSTVLAFTLQRSDPANTVPACSNVLDLTLEVLVIPGPVASLISSDAVDPRDGVTFNMTSGVAWAMTPDSTNSPAQYGFRLDGVRDISQICYQNLPDQPFGTCMLQLKSASSCFNGFVSLVRDTSLVWNPNYGSSPPSRAGVIVPAVVVPVAVLLALLLIAVVYSRRRRRAAFTPVAMAETNTAEADLREPLTGGGANTASDTAS